MKVEIKEFKELGINTLDKIKQLKLLGLDENNYQLLLI